MLAYKNLSKINASSYKFYVHVKNVIYDTVLAS